MAFTPYPGVEPLQAEVLEALIREVRPLGAVKSSNQTVSSATTGATLVNATDLSVSLEANATYIFELCLYSNSATTPDIKFGLTFPSGATGTWGGIGYDAAGTLLTFGPSNITATLAFAGLAADRQSRLDGSIVTSSTAGTLQVQFAQNTSNASNTTLYAGSTILVRRIS